MKVGGLYVDPESILRLDPFATPAPTPTVIPTASPTETAAAAPAAAGPQE
jgi:hypothetical protein